MYLTTVHDNVIRNCPSCGKPQKVYIESNKVSVKVCCTVCQYIIVEDGPRPNL